MDGRTRREEEKVASIVAQGIGYTSYPGQYLREFAANTLTARILYRLGSESSANGFRALASIAVHCYMIAPSADWHEVEEVLQALDHDTCATCRELHHGAPTCEDSWASECPPCPFLPKK